MDATNYSPQITEVIAAWKPFVEKVADWQRLVEGVEPKQTGCGPVYEVKNPIDRPAEDFAICDMRAVTVAEPHYHPTGNWEFYIVFAGTAMVVVGNAEYEVGKGDVVVIPPNTAHFTIPHKDFVIAAINLPPFRPENYIKLTGSNPDAMFDLGRFKALADSTVS